MFKLKLSFCPGNIFNTKMILKVPEEIGTTVHFWAGHQQSYYRQAEPCSLLVWGHGTLPDDHDITSSLCRETDTCPSIGPHKILWSWEQILLLLFLDKKTHSKIFIHLLKAHVAREDKSLSWGPLNPLFFIIEWGPGPVELLAYHAQKATLSDTSLLIRPSRKQTCM